MSEHLRVGFVGCGRVARGLGGALATAGVAVVAAASRDPSSAAAFAAEIPHCRAVAEPLEVVAAAGLVFLTVPDDAIVPLASSLDFGDVAAVHCCGALPASVLPTRRAGALHPLQSFPERKPVSLEGVPFAVDANEPDLRATLWLMAERLGGRPFYLPSAQRPLYHAAASLACGGVSALVDLAGSLFPGVDLTRLAYAGVENAARGTPTGPIARGDTGTVEKHLTALGERSPAARAAYAALALASGAKPRVEAVTPLATVLHAKLHRATVTQADVDYVGSITLDARLLEAADIAEGEAVHVLDVDNGERLVTYTIRGEPGSGVVGINGAAARRIAVGHRVIIISYVQVPLSARSSVEARVVLLDERNRPLGGLTR